MTTQTLHVRTRAVRAPLRSLVAAATVFGCGRAPTPLPDVACAGAIAPPPGFSRVDEPLLPGAKRAPGGGFLCEGAMFASSAPVRVYRLFSRRHDEDPPLGRSWTATRPSGSAAIYRAAFSICAEWNDLDMLESCTLDAGARAAIGPGQSSACKRGESFPASPTNQLVLAPRADGSFPVHDCSSEPIRW